MLRILTNHIGYDCDDTKKAIFIGDTANPPSEFAVFDYATEKEILTGKLTECGEVDNWKTGHYYSVRFDELNVEGKYYITVKTASKDYSSMPFDIAKNLLEMRTLSTAGYYFKAQRPTGEFDSADKNLRFRGLREGNFDVRGGWYDATGDYGIHLSHLSHSTYFNSQQAAFTAYSFFKFNDLLEESGYPYYTMLKRRMLDEGMYGADFLMRMRAPSGSFFRSKGRDADAYKPIHESRCISCEFLDHEAAQGNGVKTGYEGVKDENYEVSFRSGGGYAIATLAYAARTCFFGNEFTSEEYLNSAIKAYNYLDNNNDRYTNDGKENLLDFYCRLDAVVELYKTTRIYDYLRTAQNIVEKINSYYVEASADCGYLSVNGTDRPYFHAADEGMPIVNLLNYYNIEQDADRKAEVLNLCERLMRHHIKITCSVNNPFGYARMYRVDGNGVKKESFFYPHDVETAPWWQGEDARIASLATAARSLAFITADSDLKASLCEYADDQINWILGLNPFDSCMMEGVGRNVNNYFYECRKDFIHCPGGIVNGITAGLNDEHGIEFIRSPNENGINDNWRWAEQWIPHCTWFMYALTTKRR